MKNTNNLWRNISIMLAIILVVFLVMPHIIKQPVHSYDYIYDACDIQKGKLNWDTDLNKCNQLIIQRIQEIERQNS